VQNLLLNRHPEEISGLTPPRIEEVPLFGVSLTRLGVCFVPVSLGKGLNPRPAAVLMQALALNTRKPLDSNYYIHVDFVTRLQVKHDARVGPPPRDSDSRSSFT
jgi:hypothetical protein